MEERYKHFYNKDDREMRRKRKTGKASHSQTSQGNKGKYGGHRDNGKSAGSSKKRIALNKKQRVLVGLFCGTLFVFVVIMVIGSIVHLIRNRFQDSIDNVPEPEVIEVPALVGVADRFPDLPITEDFLSINEYSRPGLALSSNPQYIVIHYTANPGSTAKQNRDYFENLQNTHITYASAQFVIGLEGEIEQCVPCNEIAYCSNSLNDVSISIEMCHPDEEGNFYDATYNNCVYLVAHLMNYYHMDMDHLIRHYDVTGKNCPKYFVEHPDRWQVFKDYVEEYREKFKEEQ